MSIGIGLQALGAGWQGGNPGSVIERQREQLESAERKKRVASLLERMNISGPQRAILETMPAAQVPGLLWQMQQQEMARRAAGGAAAAKATQERAAAEAYARAFEGAVGGTASGSSPYSMGTPVSGVMPPSQELSFGQPAPAPATSAALSFGEVRQPAPASPYDRYKRALDGLYAQPTPVDPMQREVRDRLIKDLEARVEYFAPPKPDDSSKEEQISRIMENGYTRAEAISVVDGINEITPTGELMNRITGELVGAPPPTGATPTDQGVSLDFGATVPSVDVNYAGAFGPGGFAAQAANVGADAVGAPIPFPDVQRAQTALSNTALRTVTVLQESFPGRASVQLMNKLEEVAARPAQLLRGDQRSRDIMEQTAAMVEDLIRQEQRKIDNPRGYTPQMRAQARVKIDQLGPLLADYRSILEQMNAGSGATIRPDVADRLKAYQ